MRDIAEIICAHRHPAIELTAEDAKPVMKSACTAAVINEKRSTRSKNAACLALGAARVKPGLTPSSRSGPDWGGWKTEPAMSWLSVVFKHHDAADPPI